jgi:twinkle protein
MKTTPNLLPDRINFAEVYRQSQSTRTILNGKNFEYDLGERAANGHIVQGAKLPWMKTHGDVGLVAGDVSIWAGVNGHGKSTVLLQVCNHLIAQGEPVCIASLEMPVIETLYMMACQVAQCEPSREFTVKFLDWAGDRLWLFNQKGSVSAESILGAIIWSAEQRGVKHFVIDNLMMVTEGESGERAMNSQKTFVETLKRVADSAQVHIHLVHHVRKGENENDKPGKFDLKGSGAIADLADQIFMVWRNKKREVHFQNPNRTLNPELESKPGALLSLVKNRRAGIEKSYALWFSRGSRQFCPTSEARPIDLTLGALT